MRHQANIQMSRRAKAGHWVENCRVSPLTMRVRVRFWNSPCSLICTRTVYFPASSSATSLMTREVPLMRYLEQCSAAKFPSLNLSGRNRSQKLSKEKNNFFRFLIWSRNLTRKLQGQEMLVLWGKFYKIFVQLAPPSGIRFGVSDG